MKKIKFTHIFHLPVSTAGQLLTTIRFVSGAGICELNTVFVDTPTHTHGIVALCRLVEPGLIAIGRIIANQVAIQAATNGGTRPVRLLEAAAPLARADRPVLVEVAHINERLDALLVLQEGGGCNRAPVTTRWGFSYLIMFQVIELLQRQVTVRVYIQVSEHPLRFRFTAGREASCGRGNNDSELC